VPRGRFWAIPSNKKALGKLGFMEGGYGTGNSRKKTVQNPFFPGTGEARFWALSGLAPVFGILPPAVKREYRKVLAGGAGFGRGPRPKGRGSVPD